jgi:hypothetical protein
MDNLEFERACNLGQRSLCVDMIIIKKQDGIEIENEIGRVFKHYNIVEYKCLGDRMTINDYFKTLGYAFLYKGLESVPASELTVSFILGSYPREMIKALKSLGATVEEAFPGIYYVSGISILKSQIVVTGQLVGRSHSPLQILSKNAKIENVRHSLQDSEFFKTPEDKNNADAVS